MYLATTNDCRGRENKGAPLELFPAWVRGVRANETGMRWCMETNRGLGPPTLPLRRGRSVTMPCPLPVSSYRFAYCCSGLVAAIRWKQSDPYYTLPISSHTTALKQHPNHPTLATCSSIGLRLRAPPTLMIMFPQSLDSTRPPARPKATVSLGLSPEATRMGLLCGAAEPRWRA